MALKQFLQEIGVVHLFDSSKADLSGIDGTRGLVVTEVVHKAYVAVDEEGTVAAGSTGSVIRNKSGGPRSIEFTVDRPFLFFIADKTTGSVLFMGRLTQPPRKGDGNIGEFGRTAELRADSATGDHGTMVATWLSAVAAIVAAAFGDAMRRF